MMYVEVLFLHRRVRPVCVELGIGGAGHGDYVCMSACSILGWSARGDEKTRKEEFYLVLIPLSDAA